MLIKTTVRALAIMAATAAVLIPPIAGVVAPLGGSALAAPDEAGLDTVILRSGRVVTGRILEETESHVRMIVVVAGIEAETTYARSEVLQITRGEADTQASAMDTPSPEGKPSGDAKSDDSASSNATKLYLLPLRGRIPRDISQTPLMDSIEDAKSMDVDILVVEMDAEAPGGAQGVFVAEDMGPIFEELVDSGMRVVFWIERAEGGAGLLPFVAPEIYFKTEGRMGGLGSIGETKSGDTMVDEKLIGAYIGHAEGFAIKGGYDPVLVRAMARKENWLAVRILGGQREYMERPPTPEDGDGWNILTDDGEGPNKDASSFDGNDVLNIDADWAYRLGVSKATVDLEEDLAWELAGRDYVWLEGKAERLLKDWRDGVERYIDEFRRLQQRLEEVGGNDREGLGQRRRILEQMYSILTKYAEVLDPEGQQRAQIEVQLEELRHQLRSARERSRSSGNNRNR